MQTVWKFPFDFEDEFTVEMPEGAHVLSVATQQIQDVPQDAAELISGERPYIWALVNPENATERRTFYHVGTGHSAPDAVNPQGYVGTYQLMGGRLVFHLFEEVHA